jgi:reactive chlorine resistance protein C
MDWHGRERSLEEPRGAAARFDEEQRCPTLVGMAIASTLVMQTYLKWLARRQPYFIHLVRIAIFVVMAWIGGLKFVPYEAESIVPFVANSPVMRFFYANPAPEYKNYMNKEGELVPKNRAWHQENRTYLFADALGTVIIAIGILVLLGLFSPKLGVVGAHLAAGMSLVTLSFLITTPEAWVSHFPYLAGGGRLVIKDLIMLSGALVCLSSSAQELLSSMDPQLSDGRGAGPDAAGELARTPSREYA